MKNASAKAIVVLMYILPLAADAAPATTFEVRLVVECTRGAVAFQQEPADATTPVQPLCVLPDVILSQEDVVKVAKVPEEHGYGERVRITYRDAARVRMSQMTRQFIGHRMAIMAKGRVLSSPVILGPILGNTIEVSGPVEWIDRLMKDLTNGPRPL